MLQNPSYLIRFLNFSALISTSKKTLDILFAIGLKIIEIRRKIPYLRKLQVTKNPQHHLPSTEKKKFIGRSWTAADQASHILIVKINKMLR